MSADEGFRDHVLGHFESPYHRGACNQSTQRYRARNDPCGDEVEIELWIEGDLVREAWFTGRGCVVSQAAASMLVETLEGRTINATRSFTSQEMLNLFAAPLAPARLRCCLLAWQALNGVLRLFPTQPSTSPTP